MTNTELNRRVAELVMGEPEPEMPPDPEGSGLVSIGFSRTLHVSAGGNWVLEYEDFHWPGHAMNRIAWQPLDFSGDFDLSMRAVDKYLADLKPRNLLRYGNPLWYMNYMPDAKTGKRCLAGFWDVGVSVYGPTFPEAICRLLLALVQSDGSRTSGTRKEDA